MSRASKLAVLLVRWIPLLVLVVYAFGVQGELLIHPGGVTYHIDSRFWVDFLLPGSAVFLLALEKARK